MKPAIDIIGTEKCSSCFACYNACPFDAIKMEIDNEGFYKPKILRDKCTECGICAKVCPVIEIAPLDRLQNPLSYAAWSNDDTTRSLSTSGGIASELAKYILDEGGTVYGVVWDKKWHPRHVRVTNDKRNLLKHLRGSKYVPSYIGSIYRNILKDIKEGRKVLFIGLPCQIAGLNNIIRLNEKSVDVSNLYTVDLVCHGVPSLIVWDKYLQYLQKKNGNKKIMSIEMRDKSIEWNKPLFKVKFENGAVYTTEFFTKDWFGWGFLNNYYLNNICYNCPFSKIPRQGDITLADFWGVPTNLYDPRGVSLILVNSGKGLKLIEKLQALERITLLPVDFRRVLLEAPTKNPRIVSGTLSKPKQRSEIIKIAQEEEFEVVIKMLKKERIKNALFFIVKHPLQALRIGSGLLFKK